MAYPVSSANISLAWLDAIKYLRSQKGGKAVNLFVVAETVDEHLGVRSRLDEFLHSARESSARKSKEDVLPVQSVANTIFPGSLYRAAGSPSELFAMHDSAKTIRARLRDKEEYFDRLVAWPSAKGPVNQLEDVIKRLSGLTHMSSAFELAVAFPGEDANADESSLDLRIYAPGHDRKIMGFPCLSHISLTIHDSRLHLTALYRNQHFIRKAYGNYLGLAGLLTFLAEQVGLGVGELAIIATHADLELARFSKKAVGNLIERCQEAFSMKPQAA